MHYSTPPNSEEKLSQLMDGEWHELNPSECVANICGDEASRAKWERYHLIRDAIKGEPVQTDSMLASRICAAIADEPTYSNITSFNAAGAISKVDHDDAVDTQYVTEQDADTSQETQAHTARKTAWLGTGVAGFAMAASVAAVTIVGMNFWQGQQGLATDSSVVAGAALSGIETDTDAFAQQVEGAPLPVVDFVANTGGSYWVSPQTSQRVSDEGKLNMFLSQHIENSPTSMREGMLPYSRLVGYDELVQER